MAITQDAVVQAVPQALGSIGLFVFLWFTLGQRVIKPFLKILEDREARTTGAEQRAREAKEQAKQLSIELQEKQREARLAGLTRRDEILAKAQAETRAILDRAAAKSETERESAKQEIEELKQRLRIQLEPEAEQVAKMLTSQILLPPSSTIH